MTLPGRTAPRLRVALFAALIAVVLLACGVLGDVAWRHHSAAVATRSLQHAETRLASLALPHGLSRDDRRGCKSTLNRLCATTTLTPAEVRPLLKRLLHHHRPSSPAARLLERGSGPHGPVTVYGSIDGYPAVANAFGHLLFVPQGKPPVGVIPRKPGDRHVFFRGSDVMIDLITP